MGTPEEPGSLERIEGSQALKVCPLPEITHRLVYRDPAGHVTRRAVLLRWLGDESQCLPIAALPRFETWEAAPVAIPPDRKTLDALSTAITYAAQYVPELDGTPHWKDDYMRLPPDTLADVTETPPAISLPPKLALVAGAALGGCYVVPLKREPFIVHLVGESSQGKTTALRLAASVLGDPDLILTTWNKTPVGLTRHLASLAVLPAIIDELGAGGLSAADLEKTVFRIADGTGRQTGTRSGSGTVTSGSWRSVLISAGNRGLANVTRNPGLRARVIELRTPFTASAAEAEEISRLAYLGCGWPLRWVEEDPGVDHMRELVTRAEERLDAHRGGIIGRLARHLALCVAGAGRLGWYTNGRTGMAQLGGAALEAALEYLAEVEAELGEVGQMADQLLEIVLEAIAAEPYAFPDREHYNDHPRDSLRPVKGLIDGERRLVWVGELDKMTAARGMADPVPALRELRRRGVLEADRGKLTSRSRLAGNLVRFYAFRPDIGAAARPEPPSRAPLARPSVPPSESDNSTSDPAARPRAPESEHTHMRARATLSPSAAELRALAEAAEAAEWRAAGQATAQLAELYEHPTLGAIRAERDLQRRRQQLASRLANLPHSIADPIADHYGNLDDLDGLEAALTTAESPPTPEPPPTRSQRTPLALQDRRNRFARALTARGSPAPSEDLVAAALERFETATGFTYEAPTVARNGMMWLAALEARHGSVPTLLREEVSLPPGKIQAHHEMTDPDQADRPARLLTHYDVNAAFLNVENLELGTGPPISVAAPGRDQLRLPGFVVVTNPQPDWPHPFRWPARPRTIPTELAGLLADTVDEATFADGHLWPQHRRWLRNFVRAVRPAREVLLEQTDEPGRHALAVLKALYSATLGGMLGSTKNNPTAYLRPDWMWQIRGRVTVSLWRQLAKTSPGPAAVARTDAVYYLHDPDPPPDLEISTAPGKFKIQQTVPVTDAHRAILRAGKPRSLEA